MGIANIGKSALTLRLLYNLNLNCMLNPTGNNNIHEESKDSTLIYIIIFNHRRQSSLYTEEGRTARKVCR